MSLIYKALENAKNKGADLAKEQRIQQPDLAKKTLSTSIISTKWFFSITALAAGGVFMLANAGQFDSRTAVAAASQQTSVKSLAQSTLIDSHEPATMAVADVSSSVASPVVAPPRQEIVVEINTPVPDRQELKALGVAKPKPVVVVGNVPVPLQQAAFETGVQSESKVIEKPRKSAIKPTYTAVNSSNNVQQLSPHIIMHVKRPYETNLYGNSTANVNKTEKQGSVEHIVIAAKQAIRSKDFVSAEINLHSLGDVAGTESMVYKRLSAYFLVSKGDKESAATAYHDIVEMAPNDLEAGYNLALLEVQLGRLDRARARIRFLKEEFPQSGAIDKLAELIKN